MKVYLLKIVFDKYSKDFGIFKNLEDLEKEANKIENSYKYDLNLVNKYFECRDQIIDDLFKNDKIPDIDKDYYKLLENNYYNYLINYSHWEYKEFELE